MDFRISFRTVFLKYTYWQNIKSSKLDCGLNRFNVKLKASTICLPGFVFEKSTDDIKTFASPEGHLFQVEH